MWRTIGLIQKGKAMKIYKFMIMVGVLLLTACQTKQPLAESAVADEAVWETTDSSAVAPDTVMAEAADSYGVQDVTGTWCINGQKTEKANDVSLTQEFGTGIQLGNEMLLSENGDFSYHISINQGGKGVWKIAGDVIKADFTTYEPEVREEQLVMTLENCEDGELIIKMTCADGYILFWSRLEVDDDNEMP